MEISLANADQTGNLLAPGSVLTVPIITSGDVNGVSGATTTFINVPIVSRDGTFLNAETQGFVIASGPDGTGTMFLDSSQVTILAQGAQITESFTPVENAELGESGEEPIIDGTVLAPSGKENRNATVVGAVDSDIKPPVGKGPFRCNLCDKVFLKWNQLQRHNRLHADDKPYRCHLCDMTFNVETNLVLHKATHNADSPTCPECGKRFSRVAGLKSHIILHQKEEGLICSECGEEFSTHMRLEKHMKCHEEEEVSSKVYQCKQCTQNFTHASTLKDHMKVHSKIKASLSHRTYNRNIDRSTFNHKCNTCEKSFQKPSQLERHRRIHTGERPYVCDQCGKSFNQKGALQIHMTKHSGERPYRCDLCPSAFSQRGNLRAHILRVHMLSKAGDQPVYCCEECTCVFRKLGSLNAHISRMHADDEELTAMAITDKDGQAANGKAVNDVIKQLIDLGGNIPSENEGIKEFEEGKEQVSEDVLGANSDILQQALQNSGLTGDHSGTDHQSGNKANNKVQEVRSDKSSTSGGKDSSNKNVSKLGSNTFAADSTNAILKKHLIRKVGGIRWHQCMYCSKEFKKPSDLVRHIRIHTHEKPYKCMQCFRSFTVKSTLTAHIRTHTGVKEFYCDICEKMFSTQGSLKVHSRLHTGAKPFECPHCDKRFRTSGHRKSHLVSHMKDGEAKRPRKPSRKAPPRNDSNLPDIPLQEPILITDAGLMQTVPKYGTAAFNHLVGEEAVGHDRPYKCVYCARAFKKSSHLKQHIRSHTGEKPYKCNICLRSFVSSGVLKSHMRTHTGVKAYRCLICESSFTTNGSLKRHMSIHSEVRPFMCPYCQKTFKTSVNCKKHMKTHKHELALQASQANSTSLEGATTIVTANLQEIELNTEQMEVEEKITVSEEPDAATTTITTLSESLTQENLQQLHQSLSQHVFGEPPSLTEADLGDKQLQVQHTSTFDQSTFTQQQFDQFSSGTFTISCEGLHQTLDIAELSDNFGQGGTALVSTNIANILPTQESVEPAADNSQPEEVDVGTQTVPTEITPDETSTPIKHLRSYPCTYCSKSFKKSSHLKQHIRSHTGEKPFKCSVCNRFFVSMAVLKSHLKTHTGIKDFKCHICEATFTTNGSLTRHSLIHTAAKQIKCPYCNETFRTTLLCRRHVRMHAEVTEEEPADAVAGDGDSSHPRRSRSSIIQFSEEQTVNLAKQLVTECATISEKILIASAAEKDRVSEIKNKEQELRALPKHQHVCHQCPKSFKKPSDLIRHTRIHTGEKPYNCDICQKSFTVKSTLDSHLKTHTGEKHFNCHVCNSMFATKGSLKVHMRLHTGAKPFKCPHCELRFRTSGHRKSHISTHFKQGTSGKRQPLDFEDDAVESEIPSDSGLMETDAAVVQADICDVVADKDSLNNSILLSQGLLQPGLLNISQSATVLPNITLSVDGLTADDGQVLHGGDSVHLQLGQGIQISGVDSNIIAQTIQIDANLLHQLQQQGNINITINPNILTPGLSLEESILPITTSTEATNQQNIIIQPMNITLPLEDQSQVIASIDNANGSDEIAGTGAIYHVSVDESRLHSIVSEESDVTNNTETQVNLNITESGEIVTKIEPVEMDVDLETDEVNVSSVYVCQLCDKRFNKSNSYKAHLLTHGSNVEFYNSKLKGSNSASANNQCAICGKSFTKPSQLERHIRIHTGERPFVCNVCNKAFNQKNALQIHMSRHTGKRPHKCSFCNLAFTQKGNLNVHIRRVHVNDRQEHLNDNISSDILSDMPPLLSEICSASISDENGNNDHEDITEEEEPDGHEASGEPRQDKWYCDTPLLN